MALAPIVLFVYNRPWHTSQVLQALSKNLLIDESILYIYSDGPKAGASAREIQSIHEVRKVIRSYRQAKEVIIRESETNRGVANSIISGVTEIVNTHQKVIVLEDDILTGKGFLTYMNQALDLYETEDNVICIHGFNLPIKTQGLDDTFFLRGADCWGWATWKRGWDVFNPDGDYLLDQLVKNNLQYDFNMGNSFDYIDMLSKYNELQAWDVCWLASAFLRNKLTLYPAVSIIKNIGLDGSGIHSQVHTDNLSKHYQQECPVYPIKIKECKTALKRIMHYHRPPWYQRIMKKLKV